MWVWLDEHPEWLVVPVVAVMLTLAILSLLFWWSPTFR